MTAERGSTLQLGATVVALAGGLTAAATGNDTVAAVSWAVAAALPLAFLVRDISRELMARRPGVDVIALLAVSGALILGEFLTAAIVGLMLTTGRWLDGYAVGRAERELTALIARAPRLAHRMTDGEIVDVDADDVVEGDRLVVKPGEVVPVDGIVVSQMAVLDESALTGEPLPMERPQGDVIASGTVNAAGSFDLIATATADNSVYAGIVRLVEEARRSRSPSTRLADRWAAWFVPVTLAVAGVAWLAAGDPMRALAVLVVATPCPLLLAVPIAIVSGVSRAARRGIVFRGGGPLEMLATTRNVLIDKTGTLTLGQPAVRDVVALTDDIGTDAILSLAASLEQVTTHVLARAIVAAGRNASLPLTLPESVEEVPGAGIAGVVAGRLIAVGTSAWLLAGATEPPAVAAFRRRLRRVAPVSTFVAIDGTIVGAITFDDVIRPDAAVTVRGLRALGVAHVAMATGDHPVVANAVGVAIDVDSVLAECTPEQKVTILQDLRTRGVTAMVGDGINDAPALAAADVGVAMGARGATASSEAADVVLMVDRLQRLVDAISIAQRSRRIAVQSVVLGMGLSLVAMGGAAFGLITPIVGALIQEGIDVAAIVNALRALGGGPPERARVQLSPELSERLRAEHDVLLPKLDSVRSAADELDRVPPAEIMAMLGGVHRLLVDEILPHEAEDERVIYPHLTTLLGGPDPLAAMSRTHREIFHQVEVLGRILADLPESGPEPADLRDLRRLLYSLHAILRLHFAQEEELYFSLDDSFVPHQLTAPAGGELVSRG